MSKNNHKTEVMAEEPKSTVNPSVTSEPKTLKTKPSDRRYQLLHSDTPLPAPKGKQRQIVLSILANNKQPMSPAEVAKLAGPMGLIANAGVEASCSWHLHQMAKLGIVEVVSSTPSAEQAA